MANWKEVKKDIEEETKRIFLTCPDEIKRFHYGIITHSDAGKHSFNQYFGHWVHAYAGYYYYSDAIGCIIRMAADPEVDIKMVKKTHGNIIMSTSPIFGQYAGQMIQAKYSTLVYEAIDTCDNKDELIELLTSYLTLISRLYWWFHWYFPWGAGPSIAPRMTKEDLKEINRLYPKD
jgi:hypothetical protein